MSEQGKVAAVLLALLVVGLALIAHGLGWGRVAVLGVGFAVSAAAVSLLGAMMRGGGR